MIVIEWIIIADPNATAWVIIEYEIYSKQVDILISKIQVLQIL